jgi:ligand-binding SRPBCC domain-containing protein
MLLRQSTESLYDSAAVTALQSKYAEHTFTPVPGDKTLMVDVVEFRSPLGLLGAVVDRLVLDRYLHHLRHQRTAWLKAALEKPR